jgi:DNA-binding MarR family transcriptional regulator
VLAQLSVRDGLRQQALADRLLVTKGNVCGVLDRLEERGLVTRRPDPEDRRANLVVLTPAGRDLARRAVPAHEALIARLLGRLPAEEHQHLWRTARALDRSLRTGRGAHRGKTGREGR